MEPKIGVVIKGENQVSFLIEDLSPPNDLLAETTNEELQLTFSASVEASSLNAEKFVELGSHPFIYSMSSAYAGHRPLIISPDMIWLLICQGFSMYINYHSTEFSNAFGVSIDKEEITVTNNNLRPGGPREEWEKVVSDFEGALIKRLSQNLISELMPDFSTTTKVEKVAGTVTIMDTLKSYFLYTVSTWVCGIPKITLEGNIDDWIRLREKAIALRKYKLEWWIDEILAPLNSFIDVFNGKVDIDHWRNMFNLHQAAICGLPDEIDGWITKFYPFDIDGNKRVGKPIIEISQLPEEIIKLDFVHEYVFPQKKIRTPLVFISGFLGATQIHGDFSIRPHIGWIICHPVQGKKIPEEYLYISDMSLGNLTEFPEEILKVRKIGQLKLSYMQEVQISDKIKNLEINDLFIQGNILEKGKVQIARLLPKTNLFFNGEYFEGLAESNKNLKGRWIRTLLRKTPWFYRP